jgi:hypothetical protein
VGKNSLRNKFLGETYVTYVQQKIAGYPRIAMSLRVEVEAIRVWGRFCQAKLE